MKLKYIFLIMAAGIIMIGRGLMLLFQGSVGDTYDPMFMTVQNDMVVMLFAGISTFLISVLEINRAGMEREAAT